jgi:hypothetical protein
VLPLPKPPSPVSHLSPSVRNTLVQLALVRSLGLQRQSVPSPRDDLASRALYLARLLLVSCIGRGLFELLEMNNLSIRAASLSNIRTLSLLV